MVKNVKITVFKEFDIFINGNSLINRQNFSARNSELLRYMIINCNTVLSSERILRELWSDVESNDEKNFIKNCVYRLRLFLSGKNSETEDLSKYINIVNQREGYLLHISDKAECDFKEFDKTSGKISAAEDYETIVTLYKELLNISYGSFIGTDYISDNGRYDAQFINFYNHSFSTITGIVFKKLLGLSKYSDIIELCSKALLMCTEDEFVNICYLEALLETGQVSNADIHLKDYLSFVNATNSATSGQLANMQRRINRILREETIGRDKYSDLTTTVADMVSKLYPVSSTLYSICYITITLKNNPRGSSSIDKAISLNVLNSVIRKVIRKNDMFIILDDCAVVLLYDTHKQYFDKICGRINELFYQNIPGDICEIDALVQEAVTII